MMSAVSSSASAMTMLVGSSVTWWVPQCSPMTSRMIACAFFAGGRNSARPSRQGMVGSVAGLLLLVLCASFSYFGDE